MQNKVCIEGIRTYSFHGCMEAEAAVGSLYSTDVTVETDFMEAARADNLTGTVDYGRIALIVRQEMDIRAPVWSRTWRIASIRLSTGNFRRRAK